MSVIQPYNTKPKYILNHLPHEPEHNRYFGCEIEVDNGGELEENAQQVIDILGSQNCIIKRDGSLTQGFEIVTNPCSLNYHKQLPYRELFRFLKSKGYRAHDTQTCGLHIHINRTALGETKSKQDLNIAKLSNILTVCKKEVQAFARRENHYACYPPSTDGSLFEAYYEMRTIGKNSALNLLHKDTIEFRVFKGTLNLNTFYMTLDFVNTLIDVVLTLTEKEIIESDSWDAYESYFSDEIIQYIKERKEKEATNTQNTYSTNEPTLDYSPTHLFFSSRELTTPQISLNSASDSLRVLGRRLQEASEQFNEEYYHLDSSLVHSEPQEGTEEYIELTQIRRQIKILRKRINRARTPLEMQAMRREYDELKRQERGLLIRSHQATQDVV